MKLFLILSLFAHTAGQTFKYVDFVDLHVKINKVFGGDVAYSTATSVNENGDVAGFATRQGKNLAWLWNAEQETMMALPVNLSLFVNEILVQLTDRFDGTHVLALAQDGETLWPLVWYVNLSTSQVIETRKVEASPSYSGIFGYAGINKDGNIVFAGKDANGNLVETVAYNFFADTFTTTNIPKDAAYAPKGLNNLGDVIAGNNHLTINGNDFTAMDVVEVPPPPTASTETVEIMAINEDGKALVRTYGNFYSKGKLFMYDYYARSYDSPTDFGVTAFKASELREDGKFIVLTDSVETLLYTGSGIF